MSSIPLIQNSILQKLIKKTSGENVVISSNFREELNKMSTIFMLYCTTLAQEIANKRNSKTISQEDLFAVLNEVGLENIANSVKEFA